MITPYYDSLLVKVTAWAPSAAEAIRRMDRGLREFRIRGVATNLQFVENVINHPDFLAGTVTTRFIDETPELFRFARRRDRATRVLRYLGDVTVNGHPDMKGRVRPDLSHAHLLLPPVDLNAAPPPGTRTLLRQLGPEKLARWMLAEKRTLLTDTTMRDAHQSLLATRMRTIDMLRVAPCYARMLPGLFSLECWGGATFDVALRFLKEDPWQRLAQLREAVPNMMLQMLLRASNAVGYTNYADNVVRYFVQQAAKNGIDVFRVFDSLNWVENMRVAIDAVLETGALCEGAICYTADVYDHSRKYDLRYYVGIAKQLQKAGVHVLGIKDMAGVCRPRAARLLVQDAQGGDRAADPLPHARHQRRGGRHRARRDRSRRRRGRRRAGLDERADLAAESVRDRGGAGRRRSRSLLDRRQLAPALGRRPGCDALDRALLRGRAQALRAVRVRHPCRHRRRLQPRDAGRPVHQPARAGPRDWDSSTAGPRCPRPTRR